MNRYVFFFGKGRFRFCLTLSLVNYDLPYMQHRVEGLYSQHTKVLDFTSEYCVLTLSKVLYEQARAPIMSFHFVSRALNRAALK